MKPELREEVERAIAESTGTHSSICAEQSTAGGCINDTRRIDLADGRRFFLKINASPLPHLFVREAEGLHALRAVDTLRIPAPIAHGGGENGVPAYLLLEYIEQDTRVPNFQEQLGRGLAQLHASTPSDRYGFPHDNYLGSTPQPNGWMDDWVAFWRERRFGFQLALVRRNRLGDATFYQLGDKLMDRLDELLAHPAEPACLLHGDLWSGNVLADAAGEPVLIDPAAYYGRREADLAMTFLFGGFETRFYSAYDEVWPLDDGNAVRLNIYKLYHLLNHVNLFGTSYLPGCAEIMRRYA